MITHHVVHKSFKNNISNNTHSRAQGANLRILCLIILLLSLRDRPQRINTEGMHSLFKGVFPCPKGILVMK